MSIYSQVFPACESPNKFQMESLFDSIRAKSITPAVVSDFGLVEEGRGWRITVPLATARHRFSDFYAKLDATDKLLFQMTHLVSGFQYVRAVMENMSEAGAVEVGNLAPQLSQVQAAVFEAIGPFLRDATGGKRVNG